MKKLLFAAAAAAAIACPAGASNILRYDRPADFFEEALVVGNGTIGATVYGNPASERISLNDITLWTGEPDRGDAPADARANIEATRKALERRDYRAADSLYRLVQGHYSENFQPLGWLTIDRPALASTPFADYSRSLDLEGAIVESQFKAAGAQFETDCFASAPDSVIVVRLICSDPAAARSIISLKPSLPASVTASGNTLEATGYAAWHSLPVYTGFARKHHYDPDRGIHFRTAVSAIANRGTVRATPSGQLVVENADTVMLIVTNVTSFNGFDRDPAREGRDYTTLAAKRIAKASLKSFDQLYDAHFRDYNALFSRVKVDFGTTDPAIAALPTDVQLKLYTDSAQTNPDLEETYFQFGRYLLISSSRTHGVPATLQGLWNESILPPWSSNYTVNINTEENYWPAGPTNLPEMQRPLLDFIANMSRTGSRTARDYYGASRGWTLAHNSDIWAMTNPVGLQEGNPCWANWTMGGAWMATHIWEQYQFTKDRGMLLHYWPALKGAAEFCLEWLTDVDGHLATSPSTSPENIFTTPGEKKGYSAIDRGATADIAMARECMADAAAAARELGVDRELQKELESALKRLRPYRIGSKGQLLEWSEEFEEPEPTHRHQSHLFGLYPGHHINLAETPGLVAAASKSLDLKGDETTGWSTGWRVNLRARAGEAEKAYGTYRTLLRYVSPDNYRGSDARRGGGTYPNLLDAHSPFQIDGNFGGTAGVAEMLMQSSPTSITLLPALPDAWADGSASGLLARGAFEVAMKWHDKKVTEATVTSLAGGTTTLRANGRSVKIRLKAGESRTIRF